MRQRQKLYLHDYTLRGKLPLHITNTTIDPIFMFEDEGPACRATISSDSLLLQLADLATKEKILPPSPVPNNF